MRFLLFFQFNFLRDYEVYWEVYLDLVHSSFLKYSHEELLHRFVVFLIVSSSLYSAHFKT